MGTVPVAWPRPVESRAGIFKLIWSPGIDTKESIPPAYVAWDRICKRLRRPGIDSEDSIPPAFVVRRAGTTNRVIVPARQAENRFLGSIKGLQIRALTGRYDNPIPTRFLAPIDCLKITEQDRRWSFYMYEISIAGQCRTSPWPTVPDWTLMPECRRQTETPDYRKKCRCWTNFFPAFPHLLIPEKIIEP
jgi:hypothetical protein